MRRCILLAGGPWEDFDRVRVAPKPGDLVIACDAGYAAAERLGLTVHLAVGDFDSYTGAIPAGIPIHRTIPEKDETDTLLGIRKGLEQGCGEFLLLGGLGGRLDHTLANLQTLLYLAKRGARGEIWANDNRATVLLEGVLELERRPGWYLSVFAWGGPCEGVTLRGVRYPLQDARLRGSFPLGVSNEFLGERARIEVVRGALLILTSNGKNPLVSPPG